MEYTMKKSAYKKILQGKRIVMIKEVIRKFSLFSFIQICKQVKTPSSFSQ